MPLHVYPIGETDLSDGSPILRLDARFAPALEGLDGFSHVVVLWWFNASDHPADRDVLNEQTPYSDGPSSLGTFATRSPRRPNPIALSAVRVIGIDHAAGIVRVDDIDAAPGSPILDIKPYTPSLDRVGAPQVPSWCEEWPESVEKSADFDWASIFRL